MKTLTERDYRVAADLLGVDIATIKAVAEVESAGDGFLPTGEPKILFERHIFHRLTNGKYDKTHPGISNANPGGYGRNSEQHKRLAEAVVLDRDAALQSASWGKFQIMGMNYKVAGYKDLQTFINAMYNSEADHLLSFCHFVKNNRLAGKLQLKNWAGFAEGYNGIDYKKNEYDTKLAAAYKKYSN